MALWFDVGIKRYTTARSFANTTVWLWFDVGIKRYTTVQVQDAMDVQLWFDVGIKRYTTADSTGKTNLSCGLM